MSAEFFDPTRYVLPIIKAGIETVGPKITNTSVTVEAVEVSPTSGAGEIRGLEVEPLGMLLVVSAMSERLRSKFELAAFLRGNGINLDVSCIEARADDDFW